MVTRDGNIRANIPVKKEKPSTIKGKTGGKTLVAKPTSKVRSFVRRITVPLNDLKALSGRGFPSSASKVIDTLYKGGRGFNNVNAFSKGITATLNRLVRSQTGRYLGLSVNSLLPGQKNPLIRFATRKYVQPKMTKVLDKTQKAIFRRHGTRVTNEVYKQVTNVTAGPGQYFQTAQFMLGAYAKALAPRTAFSMNIGGEVVKFSPENLANSVWMLEKKIRPEKNVIARWDVTVGGSNPASVIADKAPYVMVANFGGFLFNPKNPDKPKPYAPTFFAERSMELLSKQLKLTVNNYAYLFVDGMTQEMRKKKGLTLDTGKIISDVKKSDRANAIYKIWRTKDGEAWKKQYKLNKEKPTKSNRAKYQNITYEGPKNPYHQYSGGGKNVKLNYLDDYAGKDGVEWLTNGLSLEAIDAGALATMELLTGAKNFTKVEKYISKSAKGKKQKKGYKAVRDPQTNRIKHYEMKRKYQKNVSAVSSLSGKVPIVADMKIMKPVGRGKARHYVANKGRYQSTVIEPAKVQIVENTKLSLGFADLKNEAVRKLLVTAKQKGIIDIKTRNVRSTKNAARQRSKGIDAEAAVLSGEITVLDFEAFMKHFGISEISSGARASGRYLRGSKVSQRDLDYAAGGQATADAILETINKSAGLKRELYDMRVQQAKAVAAQLSKNKEVITINKTVLVEKKSSLGKKFKARKTVVDKKLQYVEFNQTSNSFAFPVIDRELQTARAAVTRAQNKIKTGKSAAREANATLKSIASKDSTTAALQQGFVPMSRFKQLVKSAEGEAGLQEFIKENIEATFTKANETYVRLTPGSFTYNQKTNRFTFSRGIKIGEKGGGNYFPREFAGLSPAQRRLFDIETENFQKAKLRKANKQIKDGKTELAAANRKVTSLESKRKRLNEKISGSKGIGGGKKSLDPFNAQSLSYQNIQSQLVLREAERRGIKLHVVGKDSATGVPIYRTSARSAKTGLNLGDEVNMISTRMPTTAEQYRILENYSTVQMQQMRREQIALSQASAKSLNEITVTFKKGLASEKAAQYNLFNYELKINKPKLGGGHSTHSRKIQPRVTRENGILQLEFRDPDLPTRVVYLRQDLAKGRNVLKKGSTPNITFTSGDNSINKIIRANRTGIKGQNNIFRAEGQNRGLMKVEDMAGMLAGGDKISAATQATQLMLFKRAFGEEQEGQRVRRINTTRTGIYHVSQSDGDEDNLSKRGYIIRFEENG